MDDGDVPRRGARARAVAIAVPRRAGLRGIGWSGEALGGLAGGLAGALAREVEDRRFFLFLPIAFATGIALYFGAPQEPLPYAGLLPALVLAGLAMLARERPLAFHSLVLLAAIAAGFAVASLQV
ncbi:hypothetical protein [Ancylobacter radicis]|uniref:hypothetical protein n=1 Tax=Ancylobacter radicis TaxID=2836179 RepID=UPI002022ED91|nr:hypothetical protein [Ancylobacter radicis]